MNAHSIMATVRKSALVPHSAAQMFRLVNEVENYPQFLPWCSKTTVHHRDEDKVQATIEMHKGPLRKSFTTLNRLQRNKMMEIRLVEGPFRRLEGFWRFESLRDDACKVSLDLDFEFSGPLMSKLVGPVFHQIANTLVESFCQRAGQVYG